MEIKLIGHKLRTKKSLKFWKEFALEVAKGEKSANEIRKMKKFYNKKTGEPYTRLGFYYVREVGNLTKFSLK